MPVDARVLELLLHYENLREQGQSLSPEELCSECPELVDEVRRRLRGLAALNPLLAFLPPAPAPDASLSPGPLPPPKGVRSAAQEHLEKRPSSNEPNSGTLASVPPPTKRKAGSDAALPTQVGRYRITGQLGAGGFGVVYQGYDEELQREVAIKVPHRWRVADDAAADVNLTEARFLASLDHPGIVPVYDVGRTEDGRSYLVSKFIAGTNLARRLAQGRVSHAEAVELVARVAEALHSAHRQRLVHRDIKPANILLDSAGEPYVVDFGLALRATDFGKQATLAGTPYYMSPEQARGEGHRVDARSDIYSLGVVFYELLTGRRPYAGNNWRDLLEQVTTLAPRPPQQWDETIPRELERICLKTMAKRAADRYGTALALAEDLRH